jgi:ABC-type transport system involved in multi-copper enzyme maturation permease subunit
MIGPVFSLEFQRQRRRPAFQRLRRAYQGWLAFVLFFLAYHYALVILLGPPWRYFAAAGEMIDDFTEFFVVQQYIVLLLAMPVFAAGSITDEKTRDTLQGLLLTPLTPGEIILGKLLAQMTLLLELSLSGLPLFIFAATLGDWDPRLSLAVVVSPLPPLLAVASASLLTSVFGRTTSGAVIGFYLAAGLGVTFLWQCGAQDYLDPRYVLEPMWEAGDTQEWARRWWQVGRFWVMPAIACLAVAAWRLRPSYVRQLPAGTRTSSRVFRRPEIGDDPLRWKARWIERMTLPGLPRWLQLGAGAVLVTALFVWIAVASDAAPTVGTLQLLGFASIPCFGLAAAARAAASVSRERERGTWDLLLTTPLDAGEIIRGKYRGILDAALPYLFLWGVLALALAMLSLAALGQVTAVAWTVYLMFLTWLIMRFWCSHGLICAVEVTNPLQALTRSLLLGSWFVLLLWGCGYLVGLCLGSVPLLICFGLDFCFGFDSDQQWLVFSGDFIELSLFRIGPGIGIPWLFYMTVDGQLQRAAEHIEQNERVGKGPTQSLPP